MSVIGFVRTESRVLVPRYIGWYVCSAAFVGLEALLVAVDQDRAIAWRVLSAVAAMCGVYVLTVGFRILRGKDIE